MGSQLRALIECARSSEEGGAGRVYKTAIYPVPGTGLCCGGLSPARAIPEGREGSWWVGRPPGGQGREMTSAPSRSSTPPPNRWAPEGRAEVASPGHRVCLPIGLLRDRVLFLGPLVSKLIFIPSLQQLSFNTPNPDHYPPKV